MKTLNLIALSALLCSAAFGQSITITVSSNDGTNSSTSVINVPAVRVQGMLEMWAKDSNAKTSANPPVPALSFSDFVVQEIRDRGAEYAKIGATKDLLSWGVTNPPAKLVEMWPALTLAQKTNAVNYVKEVGN